MSNLTIAQSEQSSHKQAVEEATKRCVAIRQRLYEHAIRFSERGLPPVFELDLYMLAPRGALLAGMLFRLSKRIRSCCEEAGVRGGACERDLDRAEVLGDRLLRVLGRQ